MALTRINNQALTNVTSAGLPSGSIIQVKTAEKTDATTFSATLNTHTDVPGMSISITPKSTNSKILLLGQVCCSGSSYVSYFNFRFLRGSTAIGVGDDAGTRLSGNSGWRQDLSLDGNAIFTHFFQTIDSPSSTSALTYKMQLAQFFGSGAQDVYLNRSTSDTDSTGLQRNITMMTAMEIAG